MEIKLRHVCGCSDALLLRENFTKLDGGREIALSRFSLVTSKRIEAHSCVCVCLSKVGLFVRFCLPPNTCSTCHSACVYAPDTPSSFLMNNVNISVLCTAPHHLLCFAYVCVVNPSDAHSIIATVARARLEGACELANGQQCARLCTFVVTRSARNRHTRKVSGAGGVCVCVTVPAARSDGALDLVAGAAAAECCAQIW